MDLLLKVSKQKTTGMIWQRGFSFRAGISKFIDATIVSQGDISHVNDSGSICSSLHGSEEFKGCCATLRDEPFTHFDWMILHKVLYRYEPARLALKVSWCLTY